MYIRSNKLHCPVPQFKRGELPDHSGRREARGRFCYERMNREDTGGKVVVTKRRDELA